MNRSLNWIIGCILVAQPSCWIHAAGSPEENSSKGLLSLLRPGMAWRVEALPESQRAITADWQFRGGDESKLSATTLKDEKKSPMLLEENFVVGKFRKQVLHLPDDRKLVRYAVDNIIVTAPDSVGEFTIELSDEDVFGGPLSANRLLEFGWIRPAYRVGSTTVDGVKCDIYESSWPPVKGGSVKGGGPRIFAAVSVEGKLPVRLEDPYQIRRYVFESSQPTPELPTGVIEVIRRQKEAARREIQRYNIPQ